MKLISAQGKAPKRAASLGHYQEKIRWLKANFITTTQALVSFVLFRGQNFLSSTHTKKVLKTTKLIFLPGLHGTAELFDDLTEQLTLLGVSFQPTLISYPLDFEQSYENILQWLCSHLELDKKSSDSKAIIIAESFSTPLALRLADVFPQQISAVVIGGGFCASPANPGLALLPLRPLLMITPPRSAVRHYLVGAESTSELVDQVRSVIKKVSSNILTQRISSTLTLEEEQTPTIADTPVLLLQAQHDALIPWEIQNQLEQHLPHAQTHWLDSPHLIFQTHPDICASYIVEFLTTLKS